MTTDSTKGTMERILRLMGEKKASDVYLSANSPALIRINGVCVPINSQMLPPEARSMPSRTTPLSRNSSLSAARAVAAAGHKPAQAIAKETKGTVHFIDRTIRIVALRDKLVFRVQVDPFFKMLYNMR